MKQTTMIVLVVIALSLSMTGCITTDGITTDSMTDDENIDFPIVAIMNGFIFVLADDGNIDLRRDDGVTYHGNWDLILNDNRCTSFRVDFEDIDVYPATLTIFGDGSAELWLTSMGMIDAKTYGEWR